MNERRVFLEDAMPGDVLARPVAARTGLVLLEAGTVLTPDNLQGLRDHRILYVDIRDEEAEGEIAPAAEPPPLDWGALAPAAPVEPSRPADEIDAAIEAAVAKRPPIERPLRALEPVPYRPEEAGTGRQEAKALRARAVRVAAETFGEVARRGDPRVRAIKEFIRDLVRRGIENPHIFPSMAAIRAYDDAIVDQAVKSTVYAIMIGWALGFDREEIEALAECSFLHDVGMTRVPAAVWRKPGPLTLAETLEIQRHVVHGADILEGVPGVNPWAAIVAYQHHERHDGSGYPKERRGVGIFEYARIVGLADYYAARTAPRPHRERHHGYDVMTDVLGAADRLFDARVVRAFLSVAGLYPVGSRVRLSNGSAAVVLSANPAAPYLPVVRVVDAPSSDPLDLYVARHLVISGPAR